LKGGSRIQGGRRQRQNGAGKITRRAERRGAADLPKDIARLRTILQQHSAARSADQRRAGLEDEYGVRIAGAIERDRARQGHRR